MDGTVEEEEDDRAEAAELAGCGLAELAVPREEADRLGSVMEGEW